MTVVADDEGAVRHLATVLVTPRALMGMLQSDGTRAVRCHGIPEGARLAGAQLNDDIPAFVLVLEHADFPKVPDGIMPMPLHVDQECLDLCDRCLAQFEEPIPGPRGIKHVVLRSGQSCSKDA